MACRTHPTQDHPADHPKAVPARVRPHRAPLDPPQAVSDATTPARGTEAKAASPSTASDPALHAHDVPEHNEAAGRGIESAQAPATADFRARLREHHMECGAPSYRSLVVISRRLPELYPDHLQGRDLPGLSVTAISEVLNGRRSRLPPAGWVAAFVLACQRRAFETCVLATDPGPKTLPDWMTHYRQARADTVTA